MKKKFADRANWRRITEKQIKVVTIETIGFTGHAALFSINQVTEPLWREYNENRVCLADAGFKWIQHFPKHSNYILTTILNEENETVQWCIDICKSQGITDKGIPWFDDLYLDVVIFPDGGYILLDEDELQDALDKAVITRDDFDLAHRTASQVISEYKSGSLDILLLAKQQLHLFIKGNQDGTH